MEYIESIKHIIMDGMDVCFKIGVVIIILKYWIGSKYVDIKN